MGVIKEEKEIISEKIVGYKCDFCNKKHIGNLPKEWAPLNSSHMAWGNDSIDSYEDHFVCSPTCFIEILKRILNEIGEYYGAQINGISAAFWSKLIECIKK